MADKQSKLFSRERRILLPCFPDWTLKERMLEEMEVLDICVSAPPLRLYDIDFRGKACQNYYGHRIIPANSLADYVGRVVTVVGIVVSYSSPTTKHGDRMKFLTLDDSTTLYNATFWPKTYKRFGSILYNIGPFIIKGLVTQEFATSPPTVEALWVARLDSLKKMIWIFVFKRNQSYFLLFYGLPK
jgi:DNA polymerase III alpha subunit